MITVEGLGYTFKYAGGGRGRSLVMSWGSGGNLSEDSLG